MRKYALLTLSLVLLFWNTNILADKIVVIVGETPIADSEIQNLKKLLTYFGALDSLKGENKEAIAKVVLESAITDQIIDNHSKTIGISPTEAEIDNMIKGMAESKKITKAALVKHVVNNLKVSKKFLRKKIATEILRSKIIREVLSRNVDIGEKEVEALALSTNYKDASLDLQIITSKDNKEKTYKKMEKLRSKIKNCRSIKRLYIRNFAELSEMSTKLSRLSPSMQALAKDLPIDTASDVIEDERLRIIVVCSRNIDEISSQDSFNLTNFLGNKKLQIDAQKYFQDLRKKSYVKIVE